jgi:hypothetical protein
MVGMKGSKFGKVVSALVGNRPPSGMAKRPFLACEVLCFLDSYLGYPPDLDKKEGQREDCVHH